MCNAEWSLGVNVVTVRQPVVVDEDNVMPAEKMYKVLSALRDRLVVDLSEMADVKESLDKCGWIETNENGSFLKSDDAVVEMVDAACTGLEELIVREQQN